MNINKMSHFDKVVFGFANAVQHLLTPSIILQEAVWRLHEHVRIAYYHNSAHTLVPELYSMFKQRLSEQLDDICSALLRGEHDLNLPALDQSVDV